MLLEIFTTCVNSNKFMKNEIFQRKKDTRSHYWLYLHSFRNGDVIIGPYDNFTIGHWNNTFEPCLEKAGLNISL